MDGLSHRSRALLFALCAGTIAFVLALIGVMIEPPRGAAVTVAAVLMPAIVCTGMCWVYALRTIAATNARVDAAITRLMQVIDADGSGVMPVGSGRRAPLSDPATADPFQPLHTHFENVRRLALYDPVTGLANRTQFRRTVDRTLSGLSPKHESALFFIDLDRFKRVNDTLGHGAGDQLLAIVGSRLHAVADRFSPGSGRHAPMIGRLSGDEFTIFFPDLPVAGDAARIGRAILFALGEPFNLADREITIGASIGIALRPEHGVTLSDLMRAADVAMYHAKAQGRGRAEPFTERLAATLVERAQLDKDLRTAIDKRQFTLVFQPQVALDDGRIVAAEALLRWNHPDGHLRLPGGFLPRAEETGLIIEIGDWVIASVADTIARWERLGIEQRLAINLSRRQLDHGNFFRRLREAMVPARMLELEIGEALAMTLTDETVAAIAMLRADGATVAIDNFGTGYSNLARLRGLPIDRVKLDRSLTEGVADDADVRAIVQAVVGLIRSMGFETVAEGVESDAQADMLRVIGCDVVQGYAIAAPMAEAAFLDRARDARPCMLAQRPA